MCWLSVENSQVSRKSSASSGKCALSQLQFWLLVSGDDGGDDSEDVDEADKGVDDGLLVSIYLRGGEGRGSVQEEGGIPLGQADSQALVQVSDLFWLFLPSVPGKSWAKLV